MNVSRFSKRPMTASPLLRRHFVEAVLGLHLGLGLEQRPLELAGAPHEPDAGEVRADA